MASPKPAIPRAEEFLRTSIIRGAWEAGGALPSLPNLARMADVSRTSMWKAVRILKNDGVLWARKGGRITLGAPPPSPKSEPLAGRRWQLTQAHIIADIGNRQFLPGENLPTLNEMQAAYRVSAPTLKKALVSLTRERVLRRVGRSFQVPTSASTGFRSELILIMPGDAIDSISIHSLQTQRFVDAIESACIRGRIRLRKVGLNWADRSIIKQITDVVRSTSDLAGCVIDLWYHGIPDLQKHIHDLMSHLGPTRKPVAILDELGGFELQSPWRESGQFQVFRHAGSSAGAEVARSMLAQGHHHAAFISYQHWALFSRSRYRGVADVFTMAGASVTLTPLLLDEVTGAQDLFFALLDFDPAKIESLFSNSLGKELAHDFAHGFRERRTKGFPRRSARAEQIGRNLRILKELANRYAGHEYLIPIFNQLRMLGEQSALQAYLEPLFEQALADKRITAWIASEDRTALMATAFLKRKRVRIPRDISVAGFDNSKDALEQGLTSYDFNMAGIAQRMMFFVLHPPLRVHFSDHDPLEVEGFLVERESTGPAPRS